MKSRVWMSLFNFSGEGVNNNPVRGLVRELRAEANKGEEEEEEERVQAEQEVTGKGISRMDGEEMEERTRENQKETRLGRGMSIMNQVSVVEQREPGNRWCCVCQ